MTKYEKRRNALIPLAEAYADQFVPGPLRTEKGEAKWDRLFLSMMEELCRLRGITR
jgi:hypothetical protein